MGRAGLRGFRVCRVLRDILPAVRRRDRVCAAAVATRSSRLGAAATPASAVRTRPRRDPLSAPRTLEGSRQRRRATEQKNFRGRTNLCGCHHIGRPSCARRYYFTRVSKSASDARNREPGAPRVCGCPEEGQGIGEEKAAWAGAGGGHGAQARAATRLVFCLLELPRPGHGVLLHEVRGVADGRLQGERRLLGNASNVVADGDADEE